MIKLLIALSKKFKFIDKWLFEISKYYLPIVEQLEKIEVIAEEEKIKTPATMSKQELLEHCQKDLERATFFSKYGDASGIPENKTYYQECK